jgi:Tfp pilus assembly protein PilN
MTMSPVNLIPAARLAATRRRASVRWWSGGCGAYAAVLVAILLGLRLLGAANPASVQARIVQTQSEIEQSRSAASSLRQQLGRTEIELKAAVAVARQPDWSLLLGLLAQALDPETVLQSVTLGTPGGTKVGLRSGGRARSAGRGAAPSRIDGAIDLELRGYCRSQQNVARFILRLEQTGLFSQVVLSDTQREPFLSETAVVFRIICTLDPEHAGDRSS